MWTRCGCMYLTWLHSFTVRFIKINTWECTHKREMCRLLERHKVWCINRMHRCIKVNNNHHQIAKTHKDRYPHRSIHGCEVSLVSKHALVWNIKKTVHLIRPMYIIKIVLHTVCAIVVFNKFTRKYFSMPCRQTGQNNVLYFSQLK